MTDGSSALRTPASVWLLSAAMVIAYGLFTLASRDLQDAVDFAFALIPQRFDPASPYRFENSYEMLGPIFGHAFLHAGWWHVGLNAFFFFLLGRLPAMRLGDVRFLLLFLISAAGSAFAYLVLAGKGGMPAVGASGAVCGVFTAYYLAIPPHWSMALRDARIRNQWAVIFFINVVAMGVVSELGWFPIAWQAHLGGFVAGGLAYAALAPKRAQLPWN